MMMGVMVLDFGQSNATGLLANSTTDRCSCWFYHHRHHHHYDRHSHHHCHHHHRSSSTMPLSSSSLPWQLLNKHIISFDQMTTPHPERTVICWSMIFCWVIAHQLVSVIVTRQDHCDDPCHHHHHHHHHQHDHCDNPCHHHHGDQSAPPWRGQSWGDEWSNTARRREDPERIDHFIDISVFSFPDSLLRPR